MDHADLVNLFFQESAELVAEFESALLLLERTPGDIEVVNLAFRSAHSLKGGSSMMGYTEIARVAHGLETVLDRLRSGRRTVTPSIVDTLLASVDIVRALLTHARATTPPSPAECEEADRILATIASFVGENVPSLPSPAARPTIADDGRPRGYEIDFKPPPDLLRRRLDPLDMLDTLAELGDMGQAVVDTSELPPLATLDPEQCYLSWKLRLLTTRPLTEIESCFEFLAEPAAVTIRAVGGAADRGEIRPGPAADSTPGHPRADAQSPPPRRATDRDETTMIRVPVDKVDRLINLVGELATTQAMLRQMAGALTVERVTRLQEAVTHIDRQVRELHEAIMAVRMVAVRFLFARFPRLVRDLAATTGKPVVLETVGEDTELDKSVMEMIADPLTHLLRNAIDHGLETPEGRRAAGKPEAGKVQLSAYQQSGHVYIEVTDDGRGLDRDRIVAKALESGLLAPGQSVSDEETLALIMRPGFSTAATVTELSGRGVGMDVVKQNVEALGGILTVRSQRGKGTTFRIELPLTLTMLDGQILYVGDQAFVLPLIAITESIRPTPGSVHAIAEESEVVAVRGVTVPVLRLHRLFDIEPTSEDPARGIAIIVEHEDRRAALLVDGLAGQQQVVVKTFETGFGKPDGTTGATILGDGRVALILDVPGLMKLARTGRQAAAA